MDELKLAKQVVITVTEGRYNITFMLTSALANGNGGTTENQPCGDTTLVSVCVCWQ